jgi:nucleoside 2-deoxyribosyltransferase
MPYYSPEEIQSYNSSYNRVVEKINVENVNVNLKLFPIMSHKGMTKDLVVSMINEIDECSIFIADVSEANANVAYELGYAKSKNKPVIIVRRTSDEEKVPFDYEHDSRKSYNPLALDTLETVVYEDIKAILIEKGYSFN